MQKTEKFARLTGIRVNRYRTIAIVMSTVIAAVGVVVYSQSYGILHLYDGPFMMSFPAVSAIVIGGASPKKATVTNALIGTFLYQTTYLLSIPVANALLIPEMAEILRTIITSGIILYAFIFERKDARHEVHKVVISFPSLFWLWPSCPFSLQESACPIWRQRCTRGLSATFYLRWP